MLGFSVVCHGCGKLLYEGKEMIPLYRLRYRTDGKCPECKRKLGVRPLSIEFVLIDKLKWMKRIEGTIFVECDLCWKQST